MKTGRRWLQMISMAFGVRESIRFFFSNTIFVYRNEKFFLGKFVSVKSRVCRSKNSLMSVAIRRNRFSTMIWYTAVSGTRGPHSGISKKILTCPFRVHTPPSPSSRTTHFFIVWLNSIIRVYRYTLHRKPG